MTAGLPLCEICNSNPARLFVVTRTRGAVSRVVACPECARNEAAATGSARQAREILKSLRSAPDADLPGVEKCGLCGATASEIASEGKPGCCLCYAKFPAECDEIIETVQKGLFHVGKTPAL